MHRGPSDRRPLPSQFATGTGTAPRQRYVPLCPGRRTRRVTAAMTGRRRDPLLSAELAKGLFRSFLACRGLQWDSSCRVRCVVVVHFSPRCESTSPTRHLDSSSTPRSVTRVPATAIGHHRYPWMPSIYRHIDHLSQTPASARPGRQSLPRSSPDHQPNGPPPVRASPVTFASPQ
jgi:hypothetical protein